MAEVSFDAEMLDRLLVLLGDHDGDLCFLLPFFEDAMTASSMVQDVGSHGLHASNITAMDTEPVLRGNLISAIFNGTDEHMEIPDNVLLTPISGGVDAAFSVGLAFKMGAANAADKVLICKWDDGIAEEWKLKLDANEYPTFSVMDQNATAERGREDQTAVVANTWYIVIGTYDGRGTDTAEAGINIYRWDGATRGWDGAVDDTDANVGAGPYVDMEDLAQPVMIGAQDDGGVVEEWFNGEMMLAFMTRRDLGATGARMVAEQMVRLMRL